MSPSSSAEIQRDAGGEKKEEKTNHVAKLGMPDERKSLPFMMKSCAFVMKISRCMEMTTYDIPSFMFLLK